MTVKKTAVTCASAACLAMTVPAVKGYEGYWPVAKVDTIGTGQPCTGGYGSTEGVKCGDRHTEKEWSEKLETHIKDDYDTKIGQCIHVELPDGVRAAALSAAYNAGSAAVCRSPMVAKWNAGDIRGGCEALKGWYIRAQGRVVQGLINRRAKERAMCLAGITGTKKPVEETRVEASPIPKPAAHKPVHRWWSWLFK
jgi:lysozyme